MTDLQKLGKYEIQSVLGKGAMGIVYKAYDPDIKQDVAIKTINKELLNVSEREASVLLERFKNEAIAGRRLKHSNIVAIYEYGKDQGIWYIVMEFVQGRPLKDYFAEGHHFELGEIVKIMGQLLDALGYAHEHGVVHRDIKPANIMLMEQGQVQVTDFGIAKIDTSSLTKTGAVLGTPSYMAPEQCLGQHVDPRTDIFSAGVVLYQFLAGEKPFGGETDSPMSTMHKVLNVTPIDPSYLNVHVPPDFDEVVQRAMAKRPDDRFRSAQEFAEALESVYADITGERPVAQVSDSTLSVTDTTMAIPKAVRQAPVQRAAPAETRPPPSRKLGVILGAIVTVLAIAIYWWSPPTEQKPDGLPGPEERPSEATRNPLPEPPVIDRSKLDTLLASLSCARVEATVEEGNKLTLKGYVKPEDLPRLQGEAGAVPGVTEVVSQVETLIWPYCEVFEILAPFKHSDGAQGLDPPIGPSQHPQQYTEGDNLVLALTAPNYDAYLYVDYYQLDGGVVHLFPGTPAQHQPQRAQQRLTIGEPGAGKKQWQVQAPFGTEMIVVIASRDPLFKELRPEVEEARAYLTALRQALPLAAGDWVTINYFYIKTGASTASAN